MSDWQSGVLGRCSGVVVWGCTKNCTNNCTKNCKKNCTKNCVKTAQKTVRKNARKYIPVIVRMEHLVVSFQGRLPYRLEKLNDRSMSFQIPKTKRYNTLQFMKKHPQHIVKKSQLSWEVIGIPPQLKQRGGQNN